MNLTMIAFSIITFTLASPGLGSTFCRDALTSMMNSSVPLSEVEARQLANDVLSQLKRGSPRQHVKLADHVYMPLENFFAHEKLRSQRTFLIHGWDLNRLPEMQYKIDLLVIGELDSEKVKKVERAIHGKGIRIFSMAFEAEKEMSHLANSTGGKQIILPRSCP